MLKKIKSWLNLITGFTYKVQLFQLTLSEFKPSSPSWQDGKLIVVAVNHWKQGHK